ncbi:zinc-binding dehydrogenase [Vibrio sp. SM6]|uniref:Zinc-binding dehydrogenase n=1 Tax=Vibrio agarilyticus TaxID=2726741 RepID=A0A7X8TQ43_9VIBR|nr:zinc-binding dehydrogenase [Vibrio agarilyticus]NLS12674.1 zinc-binding dehydrogenase [Vibrio agarilyticus]
MKAIVLSEVGGSDHLHLEEVAMPSLKPGQILIEMKAAPINFIDTVIREGNMPPGMMPSLPFIPGVEGSGVVYDPNDSGLVKGQPVAFIGIIGASTYAQYVAIDANRVVALPDAVNVVEAGAMPVTYFTAYHMLHNVVRAESNKVALVYAATGGVGTALIQLGKAAGITMIALDRGQEKVQTALANGADFAFDSTQPWLNEVKAITSGRGVNYIFNPVAGDTIVQDLEVLAKLGHIVIFGFLAGVGTTNLQAEAAKYFAKSPTITFSELYATYTTNYPLVDSSLRAIYQLLLQGKIKPIYSTMALAQVSEAQDLLESGGVTGKMVLIP